MNGWLDAAIVLAVVGVIAACATNTMLARSAASVDDYGPLAGTLIVGGIFALLALIALIVGLVKLS